MRLHLDWTCVLGCVTVHMIWSVRWCLGLEIVRPREAVSHTLLHLILASLYVPCRGSLGVTTGFGSVHRLRLGSGPWQEKGLMVVV